MHNIGVASVQCSNCVPMLLNNTEATNRAKNKVEIEPAVDKKRGKQEPETIHHDDHACGFHHCAHLAAYEMFYIPINRAKRQYYYMYNVFSCSIQWVESLHIFKRHSISIRCTRCMHCTYRSIYDNDDTKH